MKKLLMEFIGTFFFILTIAVTANPIAIACMLMAWVYIGGFISGAHYNPMVSLAAAIRGSLDWQELPKYMIAQILGGFTAYAIANWITGRLAIPHPGGNVTLIQAFAVEVLLAFVLALIVLVVATAQHYKGNQIFGFAIGFIIPALAYLGGPISGGLFNPAISIGSMIFGAFKGAPISVEHLVMYVGGALVGGALAAYFFNYFFAEHKEMHIHVFRG